MIAMDLSSGSVAGMRGPGILPGAWQRAGMPAPRVCAVAAEASELRNTPLLLPRKAGKSAEGLALAKRCHGYFPKAMMFSWVRR
jgi:hypothetical protein